MRRLYWAVAFVVSLVIWTFNKLRQQVEHEKNDPNHSAYGTLLKQGAPSASRQVLTLGHPSVPDPFLPLDQPGFSFRRYTRQAFASFVAGAALADVGLQAFFYGPRPALDYSEARAMRESLAKGFWFRLPGCAKADLDPSPPTLAGRASLLTQAAEAAKKTRPLPDLCVFSQMRPSKNLAIVALARKLNVTHIIESGRKGGASALVYALCGFQVVSIELYPMPFVATALAQLAPEMRLFNGDGAELVRQALLGLHGSRVAVVLDGPKYRGAYEVFEAIRRDVVFAVFDDTYPGSEFRESLENDELAVFFSDDPVWLATGIPARDAAKLAEEWPGDEQEPAAQFAEAFQTMAVVPGGRWSQWA